MCHNTALPGFGQSVYNCTLQKCTREVLPLPPTLRLGVSRAGIQLSRHEDGESNPVPSEAASHVCAYPTGSLLLAAPFSRLEHSVANEALVFRILGLETEPAVAENAFEVVLGTDNADEVQELIGDYSTGKHSLICL